MNKCLDRSFLFQYLKTDIGKIHVSSYVDDAMHVTIGLGIKLYAECCEFYVYHVMYAKLFYLSKIKSLLPTVFRPSSCLQVGSLSIMSFVNLVSFCIQSNL